MKKLLQKTDKVLLFLTVIMFLFGLIMICSASYVKAITSIGNAYYYLIKQGIVLIVCLFLFLIQIRFPIGFYKKMYKLIMLGSIGLLVFVYLFGNIANGAKSWINLGFFNLQPSEVIKIALIIFMAVYYDKNKLNKDNYKIPFIPFVYVFISCALVAMQPDLGSAIIIGLLSAAIFFAVPFFPQIKKNTYKIITSAIVVGIIIIGLLFITGRTGLYEYQLQRFNFLKPCSRYTEVGTGYQVCNSYIAINNGGLLGMGIGNSTQKYLYLPEAYTDFIFSVIVEELGFIVGALIIIVYFIIIFRIIKIARNSYNLTNGLICYGVAAYIFIHIFVNLIGVLGLAPLTGVPLPFLSSGGSYALCLTAGLTLVQRVNIENTIYKQEERLKNKIREI